MNKYYFIGGTASLILISGYLVMRKPIGIRNNNPGNIRITNDAWVGLSANQNGEYFTFLKPEYGYRAMAKILQNYHRRGVNTIQTIINTWAPSSENDTSSYINHVAEFLTTSPAEELDLINDPVVLADLMEVIARHENGSKAWEKYHNKDMIFNGIYLI